MDTSWVVCLNSECFRRVSSRRMIMALLSRILIRDDRFEQYSVPIVFCTHFTGKSLPRECRTHFSWCVSVGHRDYRWIAKRGCTTKYCFEQIMAQIIRCTIGIEMAFYVVTQSMCLSRASIHLPSVSQTSFASIQLTTNCCRRAKSVLGKTLTVERGAFYSSHMAMLVRNVSAALLLDLLLTYRNKVTCTRNSCLWQRASQ